MAIALFSVGCGKKERSENDRTVLECIENNASSASETPRQVHKKSARSTVEENATEENRTSKLREKDFFRLRGNDTQFRLHIDENGIETDNGAVPEVMLVVITDAAHPFTKGGLPHYLELAKKHNGRIRVVELEIGSGYAEENATELCRTDGLFRVDKEDARKMFVRLVEINGFKKRVPLPLTLLYAKGDLTKRYEGLVPVEMIAYDIRTYINNGE
jgi:hypothetical protein